MHRALRQHTRVLRRITPRWLKTYPWYVDAGCDMRRREYRSYDAYVAHQKRKLSHMKKDVLLEYDVRYREALRARLVEMHDLRPGTNVLCLAARLGTEVKAFLDLGCFAVGIDLNPGDDNRYVVVGDFHALQFASGSVDAVFTNSLDHAFDLEKIFAEVRRVLKPGGQFIVEMNWGEGEGFRPLFYEALAWRRVDDVVALLGRCGFSALARSEFEYPWRGQHITFEKASPPS
ncbi:MAG TPA: class I SAM-dependent methyltransferase [Gemmatimonadaceae bacterium]|nr:class I SAM-dependent methyltransferase [Gemmatimonadaceae bacterium]